ncbi:MAG TPA: pyruvate dehydrogenase (acetyl-transferring) E1 component subunit alpha [Phycisphaerae bacterium]|nr:pyruvate dehydrogenase (acetyl-transferring) E1 component subunit alpha [Phycisphaerae bacterium]
MPRSRISPSHCVEHLSILGADGAVDRDLDPGLPSEQLRRYYRALVLARRWDERMINLSRQGRIGTYPPTRGQEAASLGPAFVMEKADWLVPSFREMPAMLYLGWPMERLILGWWGGYEHGAQPPEGLNVLPLCGPVATQCQYAAGIAMGNKFKGDSGVVVTFLGDGATSEGDFHEAMNVAGAFQLPLVMIVQNNQWAISMPRSAQTASQTLAQKALGYGFGGMQVDGNDLLAMIVASREALDRARSGGGPTLIEAITYRLGQHSTSDDSGKYRTADEVKGWETRDPLTRFTIYLEQRGIVNDKVRGLVEEDVKQEISAAIQRAEAYVPDPMEPFDHCFATRPPHLVAQLGEFQAYWRAREGAARPEPKCGPIQKTPAVLAKASRSLPAPAPSAGLPN